MSIKEELQALGIEIRELLPDGAIIDLAHRLNKERRSIPQMLKGLFGKKENLLDLLTHVDDIIEQDINICQVQIKEKRKARKAIKKIISRHTKSA